MKKPTPRDRCENWTVLSREYDKVIPDPKNMTETE